MDLVNCHLATGLGIMVKCLAFASSLLPAAVTSSGCSSALVVGVESNVVHYSTALLLYVFGFVVNVLNYLVRVGFLRKPS